MTLPIECLKHYGLWWVGIVRNFWHLFQQSCALHAALYSVQTSAGPGRATRQHFNQPRSIESTQGVVLEVYFSPKRRRLYFFVYQKQKVWYVHKLYMLTVRPPDCCNNLHRLGITPTEPTRKNEEKQNWRNVRAKEKRKQPKELKYCVPISFEPTWMLLNTCICSWICDMYMHICE